MTCGEHGSLSAAKQVIATNGTQLQPHEHSHHHSRQEHGHRLKRRAVKKICQSASKPGSVWPAGIRDPCGRDSHSSGMPVARHLTQPTRTTGQETGLSRIAPHPRCPYSVLLPVGFTMPPLLPAARWALTPPFHPYPTPDIAIRSGRFAFCGTFPKVALAGCYPAPCFRGARTFLPRGLSALAAAAVRPTGAPGLRLDCE